MTAPRRSPLLIVSIVLVVLAVALGAWAVSDQSALSSRLRYAEKDLATVDACEKGNATENGRKLDDTDCRMAALGLGDVSHEAAVARDDRNTHGGLAAGALVAAAITFALGRRRRAAV